MHNELSTFDKRKSIATLVADDESKKLLESVTSYLSSDRFNFMVTSETLPLAKTSMAELNKSDNVFKEATKEKVEQESSDIIVFKTNSSAISKLIQEARDTLDKGVKVFTNKAKQAHKEALTYALTIAYDANEIRPEFKDFSMLDVILSTATFLKSSDNTLIKKYTVLIDGYVETAKGKQARVDHEKLLEEQRIKDEVAKQVEEQRLKDAELERERSELATKKALEQQQKEFEQKQVPPSSIAVPESVPQYSEPQKSSVSEHPFGNNTVPSQEPQIDNSNILYDVHVSYKINTKNRVECSRIEKKILSMLLEAGFSNEPSANLKIDVIEVG